MWVDGLSDALQVVRRLSETSEPTDDAGIGRSGNTQFRVEPDGSVRLHPGETDWGRWIRMGADLRYYETIASTNDRVRELAEVGSDSGTIVMAEEQSTGRGRHGRFWHSPPGGGLYFSTLLRPAMPAEYLGWIPLAGALALVRAARPLGSQLAIKWPNDVECRGRKIAGFLAEAVHEGERLQGIVLGVGINVRWKPDDLPEEIRERATALSLCTSEPVDRDRLLAAFLWEFDALFADLEREIWEQAPAISSEIMAHMSHVGDHVSVKVGESIREGICTGLTAEGYLQLDGGEGVASGELIMDRPEGAV